LVENTHPVKLIPNSPDGGWYGATVKVTNTSTNGQISGLVVKLDVDDMEPAWDLIFKDAANQDTTNPYFSIGSLAPGQSRSVNYRLTPRRVGFGAGNNFTSNIIVSPKFNIDFGAAKDLVSKIETDISKVPAPQGTGGIC